MAVVPHDPALQPAKQTSLAALKPIAKPSEVVAVGFGTAAGFELLQRQAKALAASTLVPARYQGLNNLGNAIVALEMATRIGASPLMVMQNLYVVYGQPAWSAKFLIACFNSCGRFSAIKYKQVGEKGQDSYGYVAYTKELATGEVIEGPVIDWQLVKKEGWHDKKDSKWKSIPEKMFRYRAAAWLIDTTAPEIAMGIRTDDEIGDTFDATRDAAGTYSVTTESLREASHRIESEVVDVTTGEVTEREPGSDDNAGEQA
jgi:hypothetical protein